MSREPRIDKVVLSERLELTKQSTPMLKLIICYRFLCFATTCKLVEFTGPYVPPVTACFRSGRNVRSIEINL